MTKNIMHKISLIMIITSVFVLLSGCSYSDASASVEGKELFENNPNVSVKPRGTVRVGCFRGEDYYYWNDELKAMGASMYEMGIISNYQARNYDDMEETWDALSLSVSLKNQGGLNSSKMHSTLWIRWMRLSLTRCLSRMT